jgi:hypothetical protein
MDVGKTDFQACTGASCACLRCLRKTLRSGVGSELRVGETQTAHAKCDGGARTRLGFSHHSFPSKMSHNIERGQNARERRSIFGRTCDRTWQPSQAQAARTASERVRLADDNEREREREREREFCRGYRTNTQAGTHTHARTHGSLSLSLSLSLSHLVSDGGASKQIHNTGETERAKAHLLSARARK